MQEIVNRRRHISLEDLNNMNESLEEIFKIYRSIQILPRNGYFIDKTKVSITIENNNVILNKHNVTGITLRNILETNVLGNCTKNTKPIYVNGKNVSSFTFNSKLAFRILGSYLKMIYEIYNMNRLFIFHNNINLDNIIYNPIEDKFTIIGYSHVSIGKKSLFSRKKDDYKVMIEYLYMILSRCFSLVHGNHYDRLMTQLLKCYQEKSSKILIKTYKICINMILSAKITATLLEQETGEHLDFSNLQMMIFV